MDSRSRGLRRQALQKIAVLAATATATTTSAVNNTDLNRLCQACSLYSRQESRFSGNGSKVLEFQTQSQQPMSIKEFEVILALCKAAKFLTDLSYQEKLISVLSPYIIDAHKQAFESSPFFRDIEPSPIESLSFHLTSALLLLGAVKSAQQETAKNDIWIYLNRCQVVSKTLSYPRPGNPTELKNAIAVATMTLSLLGFLSAATTYLNLWSLTDRLNLIKLCRAMFTEEFLVTIETAFSTIRNTHVTDNYVKEWKPYLRHYSAIRRPLGAMLVQKSFMWLMVATSSLLSADNELQKGLEVLDLRLFERKSIPKFPPNTLGIVEYETIEILSDIASVELTDLEDGADYLRLGRKHLAFSLKAGSLVSYLNCIILNKNTADIEAIISWLESTLADTVQMADEMLANVVLHSIALVSKLAPQFASNVSRLLPRFIVQSRISSRVITAASSCLAYVLQLLSPDAVITTIYLLGNDLSLGTSNDKSLSSNLTTELGLSKNGQLPMDIEKNSPGSFVSLLISSGEDITTIYGNIVEAICTIATAYNNAKITALAQSMLSQRFDKISQSIDARIIIETSRLALSGGPLEFRSLLKLYAKISTEGILQKNNPLLLAVLEGRNHLSLSLGKDSPLFEIYFRHLLEAIISKGDLHQGENKREADIEFAAQEISQLLQPLAILMSHNDLASEENLDEGTLSLVRDAWFNIIIHGFATNAGRRDSYIKELRLIAIHSKPLVTEQRGEQVESDIELNTVLRRGGSTEFEVKMKRQLSSLLPSRTSEIRGMSYRKVVFFHAAYLMETLRAETGDCTKALTYFLEPSMRKGDMSITMESVTSAVMDKYLSKTLPGNCLSFSAPCVSKQLALIFCHCCHRIDRVQQAALTCANQIIKEVPSALCQKYSLFALLELLTLMWTSCLGAEIDEYKWKSSFSSNRVNITVELSDDFEFRRRTLNNLHRRAKAWVTSVINIAPLDVKGLLQTYLSEYDDCGVFNYVSLGRSFAIQMGSLIPGSDQRLQAIDQGDFNINTTSDFIAQYTTRQEYRLSGPLLHHDFEWLQSSHRISPLFEKKLGMEDAILILARLETRLREHKSVSLVELRDILRRAASLLYRTNEDECAIVHFLVSIPFVLFTKSSIKLGISLWLGVLNENPRMESRLLIEIAQQWELTIHQHRGVFCSDFLHTDPFYIKKEFAPSDRTTVTKKVQRAQALLAPHMKLVQFLGSHFNAMRLCSENIEKVFLRILETSLKGLRHATSHPLAREIRFQIILLSLNILRNSTVLESWAKLNFKDEILSAALTWFNYSPCWSYGGNRLQLKAENILLHDVSLALQRVKLSNESISASKLKKIQSKESLLQLLIQSERQRIGVWLYPLGEPHDIRTLESPGKGFTEATLLSLVRTAWTENAALAIQLVIRFPSTRLNREIRLLLLNSPEKAISIPEAIQNLLGDNLPDDISFQLKYLIYWAPVNPVSAITYFLPAYRNDPYILQYAVRAIESHPVDVTFFYVPQIVQTLRHDTLGYIERYIIETAKVSQLFAHQIIWNMKANAFKDEDSQIPDSVKPTLDRVMSRMISNFSKDDKEFYEKEFAFFDEVTSISGKLKPYIKRPKPEKKQKIEEELRKIKVEVGVYLPSNPEGVVIGIDRKSGRPLQSHAKAPYMATFRIKKPDVNVIEETDEMWEELDNKKILPQENSIETWQSAIFKVGDDCRQDVLALQMIAAFRGIFHNVGLDVYVFPYRVTATAPGCGVIDVLPDSISRDMLGREAVNGLYDYFVSKYGNEDSLRFQEARGNFVKSMAAYSIVSFLLQFKDRHNGNIMIDDAGHIVHIDFGFCFDIAPGGVKFERAPFKLTTEMIAVMGGSTDHQIFKWFEELCIKAFLASRQYTQQLSQIVLLMMDSGLPCFKLETIKNFKERFVLEKTEREAAEFMKGLIKASYKSYSTSAYDQFQLITNGIPF